MREILFVHNILYSAGKKESKCTKSIFASKTLASRIRDHQNLASQIAFQLSASSPNQRILESTNQFSVHCKLITIHQSQHNKKSRNLRCGIRDMMYLN